MQLQAQNLTWKINHKTIINEINLTAKSGELLGLIGPNGSGKSTLLRFLAGLQKPTSGDVAIDNCSIHRMSRRQLAQKMALVEQQAETDDPISVQDAVELGRTPWLSSLQPWSADDQQAVAHALAKVGMATFANRHWNTLSGGERQRVHIARAIAQTPQILLLDEPTNHLDIEHQLSILALIADLQVTTVIALHDLNQARMCDRIAVMKRGQLLHVGTADEILNLGLLRDVFNVCAHQLIDPADNQKVLRFHSAIDSHSP